MKNLLFIPLFILLSCKVIGQVKPDFIRTPNTGNTIVDWNLKAKTFILPHWKKGSGPASQDSIGNIYVNTDTTDKNVYVRYKMGANGYVAVGPLLANVKDYGADPTGVADSRAAIIAATNAVSAHGGGTVYFPAGTYLMSDYVQTQHTFTNFLGEIGSTIKFTNNTDVGGIVLMHDNCNVTNLNMQGSGIATGDMVKNTAIFIQGSNYCTVRNCKITGAGGNSIEIEDGGSNGTVTDNPASGNIIENNVILSPSGTLNDNSGILCGYASTLSFNNNIIRNNYIDGGHIIGKGILMLASGRGNVFEGNDIKNVQAYGIALYSATAAKDTSLRDNHIINNKIYSVGVLTGTTTFGSGIYVKTAYRSIVTNNTVRLAGINYLGTALPVGGISMNGASGSIISNNVVDSCTLVPAINGTNLFTGAKISENHVYNSSLGVQMSNSNGVDIVNNQILKAANQGIFVSADTSGYQSRPKLYWNVTTGHNFHVTGNTIQASSIGIQFTGTAYDTCQYNHVIANNIRSSTTTTGALRFDYFGNSEITNNISNSGSAVNGILINSVNSINNDIAYNQLYNTAAFTNGINAAAALHTCIANLIPNATTQISIAGVTYNANQNIVNGQVIATDQNTLTLTNKTLSGSSNTFTNIPNSALTNSTISGVALGGTLFAHTPGYGITGSPYTGAAAQTWGVDTLTKISTILGLKDSLIAHGANIGAGLSLNTGTSTISVDQTYGFNWTTGHTFNAAGIATTATDRIVLENTTLSTATVTVQQSPSLHFNSHAWNTSGTAADNAFDMRMEVVPTSGTSVGGSLNIDRSVNGGAYTNLFTFGYTGAFSATNINLTYSGLGTTLADGLLLRNTTASNSTTTTQNSPGLHFQGTGYSGSASQISDWFVNNQPSNASSPITSKIVWSHQENAGGYAQAMFLTSLGQLAINTTQTTVNGSTSGTLLVAEPFIGSTYKKLVLYLNALNGTATFTIPYAFTNTPVVVNTTGLASSKVTTISNTSITVTGATDTGTIILEGY